MSRAFPIQVFDSLQSTNNSILELGRSDAPEGTTHIARAQTGGRGRGDHVWWSPAGAGLWMSTLLRPRRDRSRWGGIALLAGTGVRNALRALGLERVGLYWPNDLQVDGKKLGGILGEVRSHGERAWIALGIGINIDLTIPEARRSMPPGLKGLATSLVESGMPATTDPVALAPAILQSFWPLYERFEAGGSIAALAGDGLAHVGSRVEVRVPGRAPWKGIVEGLGEEGELRVRPLTAGGDVVPVVAGEVIYEAAP